MKFRTFFGFFSIVCLIATIVCISVLNYQMSTSEQRLEDNSTTNESFQNKKIQGESDINNIDDNSNTKSESNKKTNTLLPNNGNLSKLDTINSGEKEFEKSVVLEEPNDQNKKIKTSENTDDNNQFSDYAEFEKIMFNKNEEEGDDKIGYPFKFENLDLPDDLKPYFDEKKSIEIRKNQISKFTELFYLPKYEQFPDLEKESKKNALNLFLLKLRSLFKPIHEAKVPGFEFSKKLMPSQLSSIQLMKYIENFLKKELEIINDDNSDELLKLLLDDMVKTFLSVYLVIDEALRSKKGIHNNFQRNDLLFNDLF